jgi:hypothetical protein
LDVHRLVVHYDGVLYTKITVKFGLYERCQLTLSEIPSGEGKISYKNYECRHFPGSVTDRCEKENRSFCGAWISAGYIDELAIGFASVSLVAILFGVTTHSRRRRIWRAVFGLLLFQGTLVVSFRKLLQVFTLVSFLAVCQISTFALITNVYYNSNYPLFDRARPGEFYTALHPLPFLITL